MKCRGCGKGWPNRSSLCHREGSECKGLKEMGSPESKGDAPLVISAGALQASILPLGARLHDLRCTPYANPLVLGVSDRDYRGVHAMLFAGAVVGRLAGRVAQGRTTLNGQPLALEVNAAPHHLHGGPDGFSHRNWQVEEVTGTAVTLHLHDGAGQGGYPAAVDVRACYALRGDATLSLTLEARSDGDTLLNLCHHPYFNLSGAPTINDHRLHVAADTYLPADATALPTGQISDVTATPFDFRTPRTIGEASYDNSLCLHHLACGPLAYAARLEAQAGPAMEIWTTQPALHVYDASSIMADGDRLRPRAGLALEAQGFPDAPNQPQFPSVALRKGALYRQVTEYRFFP